MRYTIYTITDIRSNNVVYVGKTNNFERRKYQHLSLNAHTKDWIASIGVDNISITPIAEFQTEEEALKCEDELIIQYNTIQDGFNARRSGLIKVTDENAYNKRLYVTNEEYRKNKLEHQKQWNQEHKEEIKEKSKQYYQEHKREIAEQMKRYRQEHKEEYKEYQKQWREEHREYNQQYYQKKKAEKQKAGL